MDTNISNNRKKRRKCYKCRNKNLKPQFRSASPTFPLSLSLIPISTSSRSVGSFDSWASHARRFENRLSVLRWLTIRFVPSRFDSLQNCLSGVDNPMLRLMVAEKGIPCSFGCSYSRFLILINLFPDRLKGGS